MKKAFTLIELLVAVAIMAVLSTIVMSQFEAARAKSRDNKRIADVAQLQLAIQLYFDRCGVYPTSSGTTLNLASVSTNCTGIKPSTFLNALPVPPQPAIDATYSYYAYAVKKSTLDDYYIGVRLERPNKALDDDIDVVTPTGGWTGATGWGATNDSNPYYYMVGSK